MDPEYSPQVSKVIEEIKSDFGFEESVAHLLIEIGLDTEATAEEFSVRSQEIVPDLPLTYAISILSTIRRNLLPDPETSAGSGSDPPEPSRVFHAAEESLLSQKGWLSRVASSRTALMKMNLADPVPRTKRFPFFGSEEETSLTWPGESTALVVVSKRTPLTDHLGRAKDLLSKAKRSSREFSCLKNFYIDDLQNILSVNLDLDKLISESPSIIVLEAHRRTTVEDIAFVFFKKLFFLIPNFLLVFDSSAISEIGKLSSFFSECTVTNLVRHPFNSEVKILYSEHPISDYLEAAAILAVEIHVADERPGDIIVYLAGEEEIDPVCRSVIGRMRMLEGINSVQKLDVLPVFLKRKTNEPRLLEGGRSGTSPPERKVIVTTTEAESLFEFENVHFVIDCGLEKRVSGDPRLETNSEVFGPISQHSARRRAERAGRAGPGGRCYRLYTKAAFLEEMGPAMVPEIMRANLGETLLRMKSLGMLEGTLLDRPPRVSVLKGLRQLHSLGALNSRWGLTSLGRAMSDFPVGPVHSKILLVSARDDFGCSKEALTIVAMVQAGNVFDRPEEEERRARADSKWAGFFQPEGDHLTLLAVFEGWGQNGFSSQWCLDNFVDFGSMTKAYNIRNRLLSVMYSLGLEIVSAENDYTKIRKAIVAGLFFHAAKWDPQEGCYRAAVDNRTVHINPRSALFNRQKPRWVVFEDVHVMSDDKEYMIGVTAIDPRWLQELDPPFFGNAAPTNDGNESGVQRS